MALDLQQGCQDHPVGKGQSFQEVVLGSFACGDAHAKRRKLGPSVRTDTKINSKRTKDLAINTKTIKS